MRTLLADDRLQLLLGVLCLASGTWRGVLAAALVIAMVTGRRMVRRSLAAPPASVASGAPQGAHASLRSAPRVDTPAGRPL
jgi:hypothetical protein